jgi:hypothetical protein
MCPWLPWCVLFIWVGDRGGVISHASKRSADTVKPGNIRSDYGSVDHGNAIRSGIWVRWCVVRCESGSDLRLETSACGLWSKAWVLWVGDEMAGAVLQVDGDFIMT